MKIAIVTAALSLTLAFSAGAAEYQSPAAKQLYACERGPVNRVALTLHAPCCADQLACSQFLSTTTMVKPAPSSRT